MRQLRSDEARRDWRDLLDEVQHDASAAVEILRYDKPVAVVVNSDWYAWATGVIDGLKLRDGVTPAGESNDGD
jgi:hypothetical protein